MDRKDAFPILVARNDCGIELRTPNMITTAKGRFRPKACPYLSGDDASLLYFARDSQCVRLRFDDLDATRKYLLVVTYVCDLETERVQSMYTADGVTIHGPIQLSPGGALTRQFPLGPEHLSGSTLDLFIERIQGPEAIVSRVELWADSGPVPLMVTVSGDGHGCLIGSVADPGYEPVVGCDVHVSVVTGDGQKKTLSLKTDEYGSFRVHRSDLLEEGVDAKICVTAGDDTASGATRYGQAEILSTDIPWGLTAISNSLDPFDDDHPIKPFDLGGIWKFRAGYAPGFESVSLDDSGWIDVEVPGHLAPQGVDHQDGVGTFRRRFVAPHEWTGQIVKLRFDGVYSDAQVYVNGERVGAHMGGATTFELDVTRHVRFGEENVLAVVVTEFTPLAVIDYMSWYAHASLMGIWRKVQLHAVSPVHVANIQVDTDLDASYRNGRLSIDLDVCNLTQSAATCDIALRLFDPAGQALTSVQTAGRLTVGARSRRLFSESLDVANAMLWSAEKPNLYTLRVELSLDGRVIQTINQRVGIRKIETVDRQLLINGRPVFLFGANRHDARLLKGRALSKDDWEQDLRLMKKANMNVVRTSHYPPAPGFLELCDEIGMYVLDQAPVCWADIESWSKFQRDTHLLPYVVQVTGEMIQRDRNHPSVIIWDLANESRWGRNFELVHQLVKTWDASRPTFFSNDDGQPPCEIKSAHYPGWDGNWREDLDALALEPKPLLCDEFVPTFHASQRWLNQTHELAEDPGLRDYWVTGFKPFMEALEYVPNCVGGIVWSWADDMMLVPKGHRIGEGAWAHLPLHFYRQRYDNFVTDRGAFRGEGDWGLIDGHGRPRPEYWHIKKMFSPVIVNVTERSPDGVRIRVRNRYSFTDLQDVRAVVCSRDIEQEIALSVPPGQEAEFDVDLSAFAPMANDPMASGGIDLKLYHRDGWLIDGYALRLPDAITRSQAEKVPSTGVNGPVISVTDKGHHARIRVGGYEIGFEDQVGIIVFYDGSPLVQGGPSLHLIEPAAARPMDMAWESLAFEAPIFQGGDNPLVWTFKLSGAVATGECRFSLVPSGKLTLSYAFHYRGDPAKVREAGVALSFGKSADRLSWVRRGEWDFYPDDHIGRLRGQATAIVGPRDVLSPAREWRLDPTPAGGNDFSSVKRNIVEASLTTVDGVGFRVVSDGTQHIRAAVREDRVQWYLLDWYGGVPTTGLHGAWTPYFGNGKELSPGDTIAGRWTLQFTTPGTTPRISGKGRQEVL